MRLLIFFSICCITHCLYTDVETANSDENLVDTGLSYSTSNGRKTCQVGQTYGFCVHPSDCDQVPSEDPTDFNSLMADCHFLTPCCPLDKIKVVPTPDPSKTTEGCGWNSIDANPFTRNDKPFCNGCAEFGDFPFMIALLKDSQSLQWSDRFIGGGALIHPSVVVTAAHKINKITANELKCRAGEYDIRTANEIFVHQDRSVKKIIIHSELSRIYAINNVALLILVRPFLLDNAPHIGIGCLDSKLPPPGSNCYSMGWGQDFNDNNKYAGILKKVKLPLVGAEECQSNLRNTRLGSRYTLHRSLTCAGGEEGTDTCMGDGGSPLICELQVRGDIPRYAIYGLVAYGISCGIKNEPGVYVNMPEFYDWIGEQMAAEGIDKSSYVIQ